MTKRATSLQLTEIAPAAALVMALADLAPVARVFADRFGLSLPAPGARMDQDGRSILCIAPGKYLVLDESGADGFVPSLAQHLRGIAAITDQSDGLRSFRLSGSDATNLLQNCVAIDLHDTRFPTGSTTATMIGLMRVHLSRIADAPLYELSVARSLADSLVSHMLASKAGQACAYLPLPLN